MGICVVVLGMHRSGTSAVSGALSCAGVYFGNNLLAPAPFNPKGFFEHKDILYTNEEILRTFDSSFEDIKPLPPMWHKSLQMVAFKERLKDIIERDFSEVPVFGFKDPRISILLPLYLDLFKELGLDVRFVVSERSSVEIAESLKERIGFSLYDSLALCQKYKQSIEEGIVGELYTRVQMDDITRNPIRSVESIIEVLKLPIKITELESKKITDFIDVGLKHHTFSTESVIMGLIKEKESVVKELELNTAEQRILKEKLEDGLKSGLQKDEKIKKYEQLIKEEKERSSEQIQKLNQDILTLLVEKDRSFQYIKKLDEDMVSLQEEKENATAILESQIQRLNHTLAHRDHQLKFMEQELSRFDGIDVSEYSKTQAELGHLRNVLASIHRSFSWKIVSTFQNTLDRIISPKSALRQPYVKFLRRLQDVSSVPAVDVVSHIHNDEQIEIVPPSPIDILFINHEESLTGAPRIICEIAKEAMKKYSIAVISKMKGGMSEEFQEAFLGRLYYPHDLLEQRERHAVARLMLKKIKPKMVYVNSVVSYEYAAEAKKLGIPVIFHVHEMASAYEVAVSHESHSDFANFADMFIAVSEVTKYDLMKIMNVPENRIRLIHEFVESEHILNLVSKQPQSEVEEILNIKPDDILVVSMGTFDKRKGADLFVKIAKKISNTNNQNKRKIKMLWVGRRPHQHDIYSSVFKEYRDHFLHINELKNPFPFLARADVFFLSSREDPFPLVVLEAMVLEKPIVAFSKSGGASEAAKGSMVLVDNFSIENAHKAIVTLASDDKDRKRRGSVGKERQKMFEKKISIQKVLGEIEKLISQVV